VLVREERLGVGCFVSKGQRLGVESAKRIAAILDARIGGQVSRGSFACGSGQRAVSLIQ